MSQHHLRVSLVAALSVVSFMAAPAFLSADHSWLDYHWPRTTNPVTITLGDNTSGAWLENAAVTAAGSPAVYIDAAAIDWNDPPPEYDQVINVVVGAGMANSRNCKSVSGRVEVCNSRYGNNGWLGIAQIWVSGSHIQKGVVKLNDTYFETPAYNSPAWRQFVMCQEVGHTFGLDHQDEGFGNSNLGSCMDYTDDPTRDDGLGDNLHLNAHDFEELEQIYAHADAPSGGGGGGRGRGGLQSQPGDAGEWGRLVRDRGRGAVYVADLGVGNRLVTFVLWAN
jgi:hypothetical protein